MMFIIRLSLRFFHSPFSPSKLVRLFIQSMYNGIITGDKMTLALAASLLRHNYYY